ncbi:addiction module toxin, RelE/StbE family [Treponema sp. JC4]|uniref:type II toxin-antitoxin system RelE/ParE family toxin n=1 Tax=Treponema sp. JC4 TaxID=1124982 RepID=UPI00025AFB5B|nr:type II toxin-antitoxin system RelE/ParE family toxin [Treponema sp. JC4]EID85993.1 addiction module toxin, RelE/StbE family [Treponema sp. JC4]
MYIIEYLSDALEDLKEITSYITNNLQNPSAAKKNYMEIIAEIESLSDFPYSAPIYYPLRPLKKEYRKLLVNNYLIFYWVCEKAKTVTIARIIYARRNISRILEA